MTKLFAFALVLLTATLVAAQPGAGTDIPPAFKMVTNVDQKKGQVFILETLHKAVPVTVERVVVVNGKEERVTETRQQMVAEQRMIVIDMSSSRVITPDEKQLPLDDVWKKMKANSVIVMSANGNTPAAAYLRALHPETMVLIPGPPPAPKNE
jgi:SpoU rRNA methylase family enzyme